ncbi:hypothetical protein [Microbulbifer sp. ANSA005]|uniref:hypothetical protein n=1 Tax=Microbulbifer sp. ANSA005 TaxID=3243362 RepID=UPI004040EEF0
MISWLKNKLLNRKDPRVITKSVPLEALIEKMKEQKDIIVTICSDGVVAAECKDCKCSINVSSKDGLIWYMCGSCKRSSFNPEENLTRDIKLANQFGGKFEYEIFYFKELPPGLVPPNI